MLTARYPPFIIHRRVQASERITASNTHLVDQGLVILPATYRELMECTRTLGAV